MSSKTKIGIYFTVMMFIAFLILILVIEHYDQNKSFISKQKGRDL